MLGLAKDVSVIAAILVQQWKIVRMLSLCIIVCVSIICTYYNLVITV